MEALLEAELTRDLRHPEQSAVVSHMSNRLTCTGRIKTERLDGLEEVVRHEEVSLTNNRPMVDPWWGS